MDINERCFRSAAENFHKADAHMVETEMHLKRLLQRLERASSPAASTSLNRERRTYSFERPVTAGT